MHTYVINLARSPDRRRHIVAELQKTGSRYEIVEAVDGRDLDLNDTSLVDPGVVGNNMLRSGAGVAGVVGCALSHLRVYRKMMADGFDRALVLEDDVSLPADLVDLADSIGKNMTGAEIVLLNFHSPVACRVTREGSVALPSSRVLVRPVDIRELTSSGAYVITAEAAARMEQATLPVKAHPDDWEIFRREGALDGVRCVAPMPVANVADFRSTIDHYEPGSLQARLREWVATVRVPVLYQALARRRQVTFRREGWFPDIEFVSETPAA
jgi:glycosyl transferase family 25